MADLLLSIFPGVDLLGHAFELEWPEACVVRGPDVIFGSLSDVRTFHPPAGVFSGIIGGPPCQAFSALAHLVHAKGYEPHFGNLIPEFERVVLEAQPDWFLMENVPAAPEPVVKGYGAQSFLIDNAWLGEEQRRRRRISFGLHGRAAPNLMRWIEQAALELPKLSRAVVGDQRDTPVKIGGSGKLKVQCGAVSQNPVNNTDEAKGRHQQPGLVSGGIRAPHQRDCVTAAHAHQQGSVTSSDGGASVRMSRYTIEDALRLQGLPENFLKDAPFTKAGKLKAVANGVCLYTGRALAKAVLEAVR